MRLSNVCTATLDIRISPAVVDKICSGRKISIFICHFPLKISDHKMSTKTKETSLNREEKGAEIKHENKNVDKRKEESGMLGFIWKFLSKISIEPAVIIMNLAWTMYWVQTSNLYIEKTCKVGSFFFGNGTTFSSEVLRFYKILILFRRNRFSFANHEFLKDSFLRSVKICSMELFLRSRSTFRLSLPTLRWFPT